MVEKVRQTQEEEVIKMLKREGFRELNETEIKEEPYKSLFSLPDCLKANNIEESSKDP